MSGITILASKMADKMHDDMITECTVAKNALEEIAPRLRVDHWEPLKTALDRLEWILENSK
ncbi:hypothetical protein [Thalassospira povalilytica]|uniref:hypothetical protein n=1 Tax=Thalassospira povalilytica TaxID=732237 RepID=UPI003AA94CFA